MASLIEAVKRQALITFSKKISSLSFEENLSKLKILASKLTSTDVKLDKSLLSGVESDRHESDSDRKSNWNQARLAPVTYIEIFENADVTIGIFVLKSGARLPLHDHPLMYGVLKVIHGTVHILSYSPISRVMLSGSDGSGENHELVDKEDDNFLSDFVNPSDIELTSKTLHRPISLLAIKEPEMYIDENDDACVLCPRQGNLHEIHTVNGPAAFLDILAPPYGSEISGVGPRPCRYFKDISHSEEGRVKKLVRIPSPADYWSDSAPYQGPSCMSE